MWKELCIRVLLPLWYGLLDLPETLKTQWRLFMMRWNPSYMRCEWAHPLQNDSPRRAWSAPRCVNIRTFKDLPIGVLDGRFEKERLLPFKGQTLTEDESYFSWRHSYRYGTVNLRDAPVEDYRIVLTCFFSTGVKKRPLTFIFPLNQASYEPNGYCNGFCTLTLPGLRFWQRLAVSNDDPKTTNVVVNAKSTVGLLKYPEQLRSFTTVACASKRPRQAFESLGQSLVWLKEVYPQLLMSRPYVDFGDEPEDNDGVLEGDQKKEPVVPDSPSRRLEMDKYKRNNKEAIKAKISEVVFTSLKIEHTWTFV